jgi:hypothetical protein
LSEEGFLDLTVYVYVVESPIFGFRAGNYVLRVALTLVVPVDVILVFPAIRDRAREGAFERDVIIVAIGGADLALEFGRRTAGDFVQRAGDGVTSVQGALRSTQNFDAFDVER